MNITKFGHCCLLIEEKGLKVLTDPGIYSIKQNHVENIDLILITHEHSDHLHIDSLKTICKNNPNAKIITNKGVGFLLEKEGIRYTLVEHGQTISEKDILIEGFGDKHAIMHPSLPVVDNTGYFIAGKLFYPGDAFTVPKKPMDILALPVAGPWLKISESIEYAKEIKPRMCFPVHEGMLKSPGTVHQIPPRVLEPLGIQFIILPLEKEIEVT